MVTTVQHGQFCSALYGVCAPSDHVNTSGQLRPTERGIPAFRGREVPPYAVNVCSALVA